MSARQDMWEGVKVPGAPAYQSGLVNKGERIVPKVCEFNAHSPNLLKTQEIQFIFAQNFYDKSNVIE